MKGVLILAHGSRRKETEQTLESIAGLTRELLPDRNIDTAYMEFSEKSIPVKLEQMLEAGIDDITAVPYFLFDGIHIRQDIPEIIDGFSKNHPGVTIRLGEPLGVDLRLAQLLAQRIEEAESI